ncbi:ribbon-helix-helix domain-containing protein [Methanobrevibacter sp. TMH8]|uniref:ribbon-helix-helix domain-containing protein n=1 Tax=Methanobrevibacter sp. TMH8 TaxID=2848611 RepID=UPI001CCCB385|nr:ribbon-helix-helix domain-containing protein [Methanobrevibacter sp. TMH8]MBZ9570608.1 ribbon-helix-helix domain-containing protein [Methanobrevibacter sp. TMH8]
MISIENEGKVKHNKSVATKLTPIEYKEITKLVEAGIYLNSSDFVREAIRDKLKAIKVVKIRDVDYEIAKKEVLGYYRSHLEAYISEVAEDLELDLELVIKITNELKKERRLDEV